MLEITNKTKTELETTLRDKREELRKFRFDTSGSKIKNVKLGKNLKKDIARILTKLKLPINK